MILTLLLLVACKSDCLGRDCDTVPDVPWDPGDGGDGDDYGSGDSGDAGDAGDSGDSGDTGEPVEIISVRDCDVTVKHRPDESYSTVAISGEFNGWSFETMSGPAGDGYYTVDLGKLGAGEYAFKYVYDGTYESAPPDDVYTMWLGGTENRDLRVGDCMLPLLQTVSAKATSSGTLTATVQFASAADEVAIDPDRVTVTVGDDEVTPAIDVEEGTITVTVSGLSKGKHSLRVWASDEDGRAAENEPLFVPLWVEDEAFDWRDGEMYFVFTDRFRNGDYGETQPFGQVDGVSECANYDGGDFLGVMDAMDDGYFDDLGANVLWLSPIYENPDGAYLGTDGTHYYSGYHGYWPILPDGIEGRFGDVNGDADDRLHELIALAHSHGIRVLFDLVLNHVHEDHIYVSEHPAWFGSGCVCGTEGCGWEEKPVECWFTAYLPDLDYKNHDITMQVLSDTLNLIQEYDVDAVRIDAAKHMDHVIMRSLRKRLHDDYEAGGGAKFWLVGETFTGDRGLIMDYVGDNELSGQFDFPLYYSIRSTFIDGGSFSDLESAVSSGLGSYGDAVMSPFLGNHDVERFATAVSGQSGDCWSGWTEDPMADGGSSVTEWDIINKMSMAFTFTLTQPGAPLIYYGDEIGLHGGEDPDNRRMMSFPPYLSGNQEELLGRVQAVGQARANSKALRRGDRKQLWVDSSFLVYALDNAGGEVAIVAMNKGSSTRTESVDVSSLGVSGATFTDALGSGRSATESGGKLTISVDSWQSQILLR